MRIIDTPLPGLALLELKAHSDERGYFIERFRDDLWQHLGLSNKTFVQQNHSRSNPGVLRGLHYQFEAMPSANFSATGQGKLVSVVAGKIWDVAVDIRPQSPTFGQYFGCELSDENHRLLWIPGGFAHGFCVLGNERADVVYLVDEYYNPIGEGGIRYDDPQIAIQWPVSLPQCSPRDLNLPSFETYKEKLSAGGAK